nr:GAF domain-containing protein [Micromonospora sp. DSM 115978]
VRVADVAHHPDAVGFPDGHPTFTTFLSVPITMRGSVFGNLYLGGKRGDVPFTQQDEDLVAALASTVGFAIENARLYEETRQRQAWLAAIAEITTALLSVNDPEAALGLVARRVRQVAAASVAAILRPAEPDRLVVAVAARADDVQPELPRLA